MGTQKKESHKNNLIEKDAIDKMRKLIDKGGSCFFVTRANLSNAHKSRPMAVQKTDEVGYVWFLSAADSVKNMEIAKDTNATLYFQGSSHSDFLELNGRAVVSKDRAKIEELWGPSLKAWFPEGKEDPSVSVIQFIPESGYYWDNKHGNTIAGIKVLINALVGGSVDDSREGELNL